MAPVVKELQKHPDRVRSVVCATGQHRQMLDQVLDLFRIRPDVDLDVMQPDQSLSQLTSSLFTGLDEAVRRMRPDWILAQGDTTTVMVSAIVAYYHHVRFGHVEAGLRTGDKHRPFPEEINRRLADAVSDAFFAPTDRARQALLREGAATPTFTSPAIRSLMPCWTWPPAPMTGRQGPWRPCRRASGWCSSRPTGGRVSVSRFATSATPSGRWPLTLRPKAYILSIRCT